MTGGADRDDRERHPRPPYLRPASWAAVGVGGALGTLVRHGLDVLAGPGSDLPWSTAAVNLLGAFLLGLVLELGTRRASGHRARELGLLLIGTGFLGGLTTYSTFALQVVALGEGAVLAALGYGVGLVVAGLVAAAGGVAVGTRIRRDEAGPRPAAATRSADHPSGDGGGAA